MLAIQDIEPDILFHVKILGEQHELTVETFSKYFKYLPRVGDIFYDEFFNCFYNKLINVTYGDMENFYNKKFKVVEVEFFYDEIIKHSITVTEFE